MMAQGGKTIKLSGKMMAQGGKTIKLRGKMAKQGGKEALDVVNGNKPTI